MSFATSRKAYTGAVVALVATLTPAASDGHLTMVEIVGIIGATLAGFLGVYQTPNSDEVDVDETGDAVPA